MFLRAGDWLADHSENCWKGWDNTFGCFSPQPPQSHNIQLEVLLFLASCQEQISLTQCWSTAGGLPEVTTQSCHTEVPHTLSQTQCDTTIAHKMHLIKNKDTNKSCDQGRTPDCMHIFIVFSFIWSFLHYKCLNFIFIWYIIDDISCWNESW